MGAWLAGALVIASVLTLGCGGGAAEAAVGVSTGSRAPTPVELELRTPDGAFVDVGDLRGAPALLFLFATFDGVSQAALAPLRRFVRHHPDVPVVGIAVQPDAAMLVDAWSLALAPPFTVTYDPNGVIAEGTSDLGQVEAVPTYVLLDARGLVTERHVGFASQRKLDRMLGDNIDGADHAPPQE